MKHFNTQGRVSVIIDGQYGSTGKGSIAAYCALHSPVNIAVTNASANAGHTTILEDGTKFVTFHLPTAGVINKKSAIYLDAGAIIDPELLQREMKELDVNPNRMAIHPNAAIITSSDKEYEANEHSGATKIASTQKGCGRALARKVMREGVVAKNFGPLQHMVRSLDLNGALSDGASIQLEIPQGFSLGNDQMFYPSCTSRIVSVSQGMSDAGIHPSFLGNVMMSIRTFPIRVGNIKLGNREIGYSGDVYADQNELTWEQLGQPEELTTVTKRVRRVFNFSLTQYSDALKVIRPTHTFLNFVNYIKNQDYFDSLCSSMSGTEICTEHGIGRVTTKLFGVGPCVTDIVEKETVMERMRW